MNTLHQKRHELRRRKYWLLFVLVFGFGWCVVEPIEAQRTGSYRGSRRSSGLQSQADQNAQDALEKIETAAMILLTDHILQATPPPATALPTIKTILEENRKFHGKFPKERKVYLYVLESLLAHYTGDRDVALARAQRAYRDDPQNPDLSDLIIVLSLCYENYEVAKEAFANRKESGSAVLGKRSPAPGALVNRGPREPNVPGFQGSRPKEPNTSPRSRPGLPSARPGGSPTSKWDQLLGTPPGQQTTRPGVPGRTPPGPGTAVPGRPGGTTMPGGMPRINPRASLPQSPAQNYQTILNLPVEYMVSQELGKDFASMNLRSVNGSYFPIASGKGQIFCALLWTSSGPHPQSTTPRLPGIRSTSSRHSTEINFRDEEDFYGRGYSSRSRMPTTARSGVSGQAREISNVAFDLDTNVNQFRDLFLHHINEGKIGFVGINYDTSISQVKQMLFEQPLPWPTCLTAEGVNRQQWPLPNIAGALLLLVDTKGKIRYIGPVGGFLPQMLLDMELGTATTAKAEVPDIPTMSDPSSEPNVHIRKKPVSAPPAIARKTPGTRSGTSQVVTLTGSNLEARNLLRAAQMQRRLTPISALRSCDEVLERWPNSPEAQEAKVMIKSLLEHGRLPNNIKEERTRQGKYVGEE